MARLWGSGTELNSTTNNVEFTTNNTNSIQTSVVRSGTYAGRLNPTASTQNVQYQFTSSTIPIYVRVYIRIASAPDNAIPFLQCLSSTNVRGYIRINTNRTLSLMNGVSGSQVGSDSSALSLDTWYCVELFVRHIVSGASNLTARLDGIEFASATNLSISSNTNILAIGNISGQQTATYDIYYDDIAINDMNASQNSWPGEGEIIHLRPNANGDTYQWNTGSGVNDYTAVDEVTPDDAATHIGETTNGQIAEFNLDATPAAMDSDDVISCVQVGWRFAATVIATQPTSVLRIKASSGGTVEESANTTHTTASWSTNAVAAPRNYHLTLYDLPGASTTEWTKADLDTAQIGIRLTNTPTIAGTLTTIWLLVDHKPAEVAATAIKDVISMGFLAFPR